MFRRCAVFGAAIAAMFALALGPSAGATEYGSGAATKLPHAQNLCFTISGTATNIASYIWAGMGHLADTTAFTTSACGSNTTAYHFISTTTADGAWVQAICQGPEPGNECSAWQLRIDATTAWNTASDCASAFGWDGAATIQAQTHHLVRMVIGRASGLNYDFAANFFGCNGGAPDNAPNSLNNCGNCDSTMSLVVGHPSQWGWLGYVSHDLGHIDTYLGSV